MKANRVNPVINIDSTEDDAAAKQGDDSAPVSRWQFNKLVVQVEQLQTQMLHMSSVIANFQGANTDNGISLAAAAEVESAVTTLEEAKKHGAQKPVSSATFPRQHSQTMEPITYEEAFEASGGQAVLDAHKKASEQLVGVTQDKKLQEQIGRLLPADFRQRVAYSTANVNQDYVESLDELYAKAEEVLPFFTRIIESLANKTSGWAKVAPLKGKARALAKSRFKYAEENGSISYFRLTDIVRATLVYKDIVALYGALKKIVAFFQSGEIEGCSVRELNDRYQNPMAGGYRDIQLVVQFQNHMCELQLNTEEMLRAKSTTGHRGFEVLRELAAATKENDLDRVKGALQFGLEHLGSRWGDASSSKTALEELLQLEESREIVVEACRRGSAGIVAQLLFSGADANAVSPASGDTALHEAVFHGHQGCVWALLNVGKADISIKNKDGQTPLVKGYMLLYKQPPESYVRAVVLLAQVAGAEAVEAAVDMVDDEVRKRLKQSSHLVDHARDGNVEEMRALLVEYADPNSRGGTDNEPALLASAKSGNPHSVRLLLDFKADPYLGVTDASDPARLEVIGSAAKILDECDAANNGVATAWLDVLMDFYSTADVLNLISIFDLVRSGKFTDEELTHESTGFSKSAVEVAHMRANGKYVIDCKAAGYSAKDCKAAGYSAKDCKAAGYSVEDIVSAGFSSSDIVRAFGLRKLERKDDSERRVGARVLCEGKLGKITQHQASDDYWNYIKIDYDDGTKNKDNTGGDGYLFFTNKPGQSYRTEDVWVGFP